MDTKTEKQPESLKRIGYWDLNQSLVNLIESGEIFPAGIVGAGHMPGSVSAEDLSKAGYTREDDEAKKAIGSREMARLIINREKEADSKNVPSKPIRAIDTLRNIEEQTDAIYRELKNEYEETKRIHPDASKVLFSVCAFSAYFDSNYFAAIEKMIDEVGEDNIVFSIFLPFSKESVKSYSIPHGLHKEIYQENWQRLLKLAEKGKSVFIHEAVDENGELLTVEKTQERNGDIYSDVNNAMFALALYAANNEIDSIHGIFGETFLTSKALRGGAPEVISLMIDKGVPLENILQITEGLTMLTYSGLIESLERFDFPHKDIVLKSFRDKDYDKLMEYVNNNDILPQEILDLAVRGVRNRIEQSKVRGLYQSITPRTGFGPKTVGNTIRI